MTSAVSRPRRSRIVVLAAMTTVAALAVGGCTATPAKMVTPAKATTAAPGDDDGVDPSTAPSGGPLSAADLARIPHFPPAPAPQPVTVADGPSAGWFSAIPTDQPVAFITIDDGWTKDPRATTLVRAAHVPVTLFLMINAIKSDPGYFKGLEQAGAVIEAHTITHLDLKGKPYAVQKKEICGGADQLATYYGRRPVLFRPPYGDKDATTLRAVHDCGMKAAFFWKETTDKGVVRYQAGQTVHRGDIILMHFRPAFVDDFIAILQAISRAGLTPALLENYIT